MIVINYEQMLTYLLAGMLPVLKIGWDLVIRDEIISWFVETILGSVLIGFLGRRTTRRVLYLLQGFWGLVQLNSLGKLS